MDMRLTLHSGEKAVRNLGVAPERMKIEAVREMRPSETLGAIRPSAAGRVFEGFRWGLEPSWWDKERHAGHRLFTARAESLMKKRAFAGALSGRRAVVIADGFWLWHEIDGVARPLWVRAKNRQPLAIAALWEAGETQNSLAVITTLANRLVEPISERMPALLRAGDENFWLNQDLRDPRRLTALLHPFPSRELEVVPTTLGEFEGAPALDSAEILTQIYGPDFRPERPIFAPKPRAVRRETETGGQVFFRTRSFTREDATTWHPVVDVECGEVFCDCPDFRFRHAKHEPDVWTPEHLCKHLSRAVENCRKHGELPHRVA